MTVSVLSPITRDASTTTLLSTSIDDAGSAERLEPGGVYLDVVTSNRQTLE